MRGVRCDPERREARCLKRYVPWQDARVLEIGCGDGRVTRKIAHQVHAMVGIDINKEYIIKAHRTRLRRLEDKIRFLIASAVTLPFSDKAFDVVVLSWSY